MVCSGCGNAWPDPAPDPAVLARIWADSRSQDPINRAAALAAERRRIAALGAARAIAFYAGLPARCADGARPRMIDIGCGQGETVRAFADAGWQALGIDTDPTMAPFHAELGIESRIGPVETMDLPRGQDLVLSAHSIYFVSDPAGFLHRLASLLAEGGVLGLTIANLMAWHDATRPAYAHTFFPTGQSMARAIALCGFEVFATRRAHGSVMIAARRGQGVLPPVAPRLIWLGHRTKGLRHALTAPLVQAARTLRRALRA
jgi:SAM-dependent methyltransferase